MSEDRLDRLERMMETLVATVARGHDENLADHAEFRAVMRQNAADHAEYRADIERLYQAWPDHFREGHR